MVYQPRNSNGQATMANSAPVVIASDQTTVKTKLATDIADVTGTITTSTSTVTLTSLVGVGSVTVTIYGTYAGVNVTFEAYDGVNWVAVPAQLAATVTPTVVTATGVLTTNSTNRYNVSPLLGPQQFRVRATAYTSGTANVIIEPSAQFTQYLMNVATMPTTAVSQSGTWTVQPGNTANTTPWLVREGGAATATLSSVVASATSVQVITSNANRKSVVIYNDSSSDAYLKYGTAASNTSFTILMPSLSTVTIRGEEYNGVIHMIWNSATGNARVTETT